MKTWEINVLCTFALAINDDGLRITLLEPPKFTSEIIKRLSFEI